MNDYQPAASGKKSGIRFRYILALMLLTFIGGAILSVWAADKYNLLDDRAIAIADPYVAPTTEAKPAFDVLSPDTNTAIADTGPVAERVDDLEERLSRINAEAAAASGNANRAEGMLIAFAARRALDSGADLGYIGRQLTERFNATQPQAVAQILTAAQRPVTLDQLRAELLSNGNRWTDEPGMSAWNRFRGELNQLFVLRHASTPSPAPERRLERARQFTEVGNISAALKEIKNLPGHTLAANWTAKANNYVAARAALDKIERAALSQVVSDVPAPQTQPTHLPTPLPMPLPKSSANSGLSATEQLPAAKNEADEGF